MFVEETAPDGYIGKSSLLPHPNEDSWYYISVINNGCSYKDSVFIDVPIGDLNINGDSILCIGDSLLITAEADQNQDLIYFEFYPDSISIGNNQNDSVWFQLYTNQYINVKALDSISGCQLFDSIFIVVDTLPSTNILTSADFTVISPGSSTQLHRGTQRLSISMGTIIFNR